MNKQPVSCDIFCAVIDNFGDIGVCWRLARQLAHEHDMQVRLWVDDLSSFRRLFPEINPSLAVQHALSVEIRDWDPASGESSFLGIEPAQLVIEAYGCELPRFFVAAMVVQKHKPVWVNLEYLSAEEWVAGCHCLPSPHPSFPLTKYFFFPGFIPQTGGLLLERDLLARRDAFQRTLSMQQVILWQKLGVPLPRPGEIRVSLFCYENFALSELFAIWAKSTVPVLCLVPEDRVLSQLAVYFGRDAVRAGDRLQHGQLEVYVLPFIEQEHYDELLWACDINFVRGEDSFVRAQWAGRPFVWHIYPQKDGVHFEKLGAFMARYCNGLQPEAAQALHSLWEGWNLSQSGSRIIPAVSMHIWNEYCLHMAVLQQHARAWSQYLSGNNLVLNLLNFVKKIDRIQRLEGKSDLR